MALLLVGLQDLSVRDIPLSNRLSLSVSSFQISGRESTWEFLVWSQVYTNQLWVHLAAVTGYLGWLFWQLSVINFLPTGIVGRLISMSTTNQFEQVWHLSHGLILLRTKSDYLPDWLVSSLPHHFIRSIVGLLLNNSGLYGTQNT